MTVTLASNASSEQHPIGELLLLRAIDKLLDATSVAELEDGARSLLGDLIPGGLLWRVKNATHMRQFKSASMYLLQIPLRDGDAFIASAPRSTGCLGPLRTAAKLVAERAEALNRQVDLAQSAEQLGRSRRLQRAMYAISNLASTANADKASMFGQLHAIIGSLMYAMNFYVAAYDAQRDTISYPYFADSVDEYPPDPSDGVRMADIERSPTWYVIHEGKPLMGLRETLQTTIGSRFKSTGPRCEEWLGAPVLHDGKAVGCLVVQSYDVARHYSNADKELLVFLAQHVEAILAPQRDHAK
ncbi:MAG: GAF domain-containing protein [Rhodanobacteraceae bacterium]|nr:MAG: GAF domain-containing protein [Rhodanobacteraceae bacterium]